MAKKKDATPTQAQITEVINGKKSVLDELMKDLNKKAGHNVVQYGLPDIEYISTGINYLDQLIGGGLMAGRILTMSGPEKSGKTSLTATIVAAAQRKNPTGIWMWLDFENSLYGENNNKDAGEQKKSWLETLGVDTNRLVFIHSLETMEEYCNFALTCLRSKDTIINGIVVDSVGAMLPQGMIYKKVGAHLKEKGMEADTMALLPRSLGKFLSMSKGLLNKHKAPMIAITHVYADINNGGWSVPKGGNAFRHFSDLRLTLTPGPRANWPFNEKEGEKPIFLGFEQVITLDKTKNSNSKSQGTQINLPFIFGKGIDEIRFLANRAIYDGFIEQGGSYYYFDPDLSPTRAPKEREHKIQGLKQFWNLVDSDIALRGALVTKYKGINLFQESNEQMVITNEGADADIVENTVAEE